MTVTEIIQGNDEICRMLEWESNKAYVYKVPNTFPYEKEEDTGWTEFETQAIGFHDDWNMLIGAYNRLLERLANMNLVQFGLLKNNFIMDWETKNFFHLFEGQLSISSSYIKLVDLSKWYNSVKHLKYEPSTQTDLKTRRKPYKRSQAKSQGEDSGSTTEG